MKYIFLFVGLLGVVPLSVWLRRNPAQLRKIWVLVGFLPFGATIIPHMFIAVVSWAFWPGFVKGAEVSALDLLLLTLYLNIPKAKRKLPFRISMSFYFAAVVASTLFAWVPVASIFYVWQLGRMFLVYVVVARACEEEEAVNGIMTGLMIGICYEAVLVVWQRFMLGELQTAGTMGHQNGLGMITYFISFPFFALYLAGVQGWRVKISPLASALVAIMTVSRATVALSGVGFFLLFALAAIRKFTPRVVRIGAAASVMATIALPFLLSSFSARFANAPNSDAYDERAAFERAANMMIADHPFGVGANNFVVVANSQGYYDRADVAPTFSSRSGHVHNAYLLAAAETGYIGVFAFICMLIAPLLGAFVNGWRYRRDPRGELLLGLGIALLMLYIQLFFEWAFFLWWFQYIFTISIGLIAGLVRQLSRTPVSSMKTGGERRQQTVSKTMRAASALSSQ